MKKILFIALLLISACAQDYELEEQLGTIVGIVADKTTGEPVPVVNVSLTPGGLSTITGSDGGFSFKNLSAGKYVLSFNKEGYEDGESSITVAPGIDADAHLLIERIPAKMTADKSVLDFGMDASMNTMSFSIVNRDYVTMDWIVGGLEEWVSVDPKEGHLKSGATATIVVTVDRENPKIRAGENKSVIVVRSTSGHGSTEVEVSVIGVERELPVVNTLEPQNIKSSSVTLIGKILNPGAPAYNERGFYYSSSPIDVNNLQGNQTIFKLTSPINENPEFTYQLVGLTLGTKYFVRAYAVNKEGTAISANEVVFEPQKTTPLTLITKVTDLDVINCSVVVWGEVTDGGDPEYTERGFVYGDTSLPTIYDGRVTVDGLGLGEFSAPIKNLDVDKVYYVRSYVRQLGVTYYSSETRSFTLTTTAPAIKVSEVSEINVDGGCAVLNGEVLSCGIPTMTEKGFVYGTNPMPTLSDNVIKVDGTESGTYSSPLNNLAVDQVYYVRAYAKHLGEIYYSPEAKSFLLKSIRPVSEIRSVTDISYSSSRVKFVGAIIDVGSPNYTKRGFVYGINSNPNVDNDKKIIVSGSGYGEFTISVADLNRDQRYYVRTFTEQNGEVFYSDKEKSFIISPTAASVSSVVVSEILKNSAKVTSSVLVAGDPNYTEKGFVYNTTGNPQVELSDSKVVATGTGAGEYSSRITGLQINTLYYVRPYVIQNGNIYYGKESSFKTSKEIPVVTTNAATNVMYKSAVLNATVTVVGDPPYTKRGFYYGTSPTPTASNSITIIESSNSFGDYSSTISSLSENTTYYFRSFVMQSDEEEPILGTVMSFTTGRAPNVTTGNVMNTQCVRSTNGALLWTTTFLGGLSDVGSPSYTEFGFVYGLSAQPTVDDGVSKYVTTSSYEMQDNVRMFTSVVSGLQDGYIYNIRAVAKTPLGYVYGEPTSFSAIVVAPLVRSYGADCQQVNGIWAAALYGVTLENGLGTPAATGVGFVYGLSPNPTVGDGSSVAVAASKIQQQGNQIVFGVGVTGLQAGKNYYFRAYAKTSLGYTYADAIQFRTYYME